MTKASTQTMADWKEYETYIHRHFKRLIPDATVTSDVQRRGVISKRIRQIDVLVEGRIGGFELSIVVDCKYFSRRINIGHVERFISFLRDLRANKGILITNKGYSQGAWDRAAYDSQDLELRIIKFGDLGEHQSFYAIPFVGTHGVLLSSPPGWVVDSKPQDDVLTGLYAAGLSYSEAREQHDFGYFGISLAAKRFPDLEALASMQRDNILADFPEAKIQLFDEPLLDRFPTLTRIADVSPTYGGLEYTGLIDFHEFHSFVVLIGRRGDQANHLKRLRWIVQRLVPGRMLARGDGIPLAFVPFSRQ